MRVYTIPDADHLAQPRPWTLVAIDHFDFDAARAEGWTISVAPNIRAIEYGLQLQRIDNPINDEPVFADDRDVWAHVVRRTREGSPLHRQALALIDDVERCLIEGLHGSW